MKNSYLDNFKKFKSAKFTTAYLAKMAMLTAIAFILYAFAKFPLPIAFPAWLDFQFSELPALLAGFSIGPISGCLVVVLKCLLKFPLSSTQYVGEATDILLGIAFVLPASLIYYFKKDRKHALIGLAVGSVTLVAFSLLVNRYISVPFYAHLYFGGDINGLVEMVSTLYKNVTKESFFVYYLFVGVLPFNVLRCIIVSVLTFLVYKRLSKILHWEGVSLKQLDEKKVFARHTVVGLEETATLAKEFADTLTGGEIILLNGELGAGKTTFTKGIAKALGIEAEVTSPTFTIMNVYEDGRLKLNHLDMYRMQSADELEELGIDECFDGESVCVIEWNKFETLYGKVIEIDVEYGEIEDERIYDIKLATDNSEQNENN